MKIYVGTYGKYNEGSLKGAWLDLADYDGVGDFYEACAALHDDEEDPEFMFQDWEDIPDGMISECSISENAWALLKAYNDHDKDAVDAYYSIFGKWDDDDFNERYRGEYDSWEAMAEEFLEETGSLQEIPEKLRYYFDYEKYARDIRLNGDMSEENGHFFWSA